MIMKYKFIEAPKTGVQMAAAVTKSILSGEEMNVIKGGWSCEEYILCRNCSDKTGKRSCGYYFDDGGNSCSIYERFVHAVEDEIQAAI